MATFLAEDFVIFEILIKLSVKSLMRFKCVSKNWMTCISGNRLFAYAHSSLQQPSAIVLYYGFVDYYKKILVRSYPYLGDYGSPSQRVTVCSEQFSKAKKVDLSYLIAEYGPITVTSSCKGLLCLTFDDFPGRVVLWNPATRQRRQLLTPKEGSRFWSAGIGLDEVSGDWKVVRLCLELDHPSTKSPIDASLVRAHVLTKNNTIWRDGGVSRIKGHFHYREMTPVAAVGALHWNFVPNHCHGTEDEGILSFDLTDEVFRFAYGPNQDYFELGNWRCSLAALTTHKDGSTTLSVASPSSCGNGLSWSTLVIFNHEVDYVWREHYLLYNKDDVDLSFTLLLVDPKAPGEMTSLKQHIRAENPDFRICDYVESIISVF